jgi:hypothetical protein
MESVKISYNFITPKLSKQRVEEYDSDKTPNWIFSSHSYCINHVVTF